MLVWAVTLLHPPGGGGGGGGGDGGGGAGGAGGDGMLAVWLVQARAPQWFWPVVGASFFATHPWVAIHLREHDSSPILACCLLLAACRVLHACRLLACSLALGCSLLVVAGASTTHSLWAAT